MTDLAGRRKPPPLGKFFIAVMLGDNRGHSEAEALVMDRFGTLDHRSAPYCFSEFSDYYDEEMGGQVWKYFVTFSRPRPVDFIAEAKLFTEDLERQFARDVGGGLRRTVNLDPGYLTGWNLVLSTVKNHAQRLYLRDGVFAEVALICRKQGFEPLPWTYPDYCSRSVIDFFNGVRSDYLRQLRSCE